MEPQDKEEEYQQSVWEIYRKEWATASSEKKVELNKRTRRWQELMKDGLTASQAHYRVMREELDYGVAKEPSDKSPGHSFWAKTRKAPFVILGLALVAAIVYSVVITGDRNALNTELESVQSVLASTQSELSSTKQTLASTQSELSSTKQTLASTQSELSSTKQTLASTQTELKSLEDTLALLQNELASLNTTLVSVQNELGATKAKLEETEAKLKLYEETFGAKVFSDVQPLMRKAGLGFSGEYVDLTNSLVATNPTWSQLKAFLRADSTDDYTYDSLNFNCTNFAEMLHNEAEAWGIKTAFVAVYFYNEEVGHALNAFKTTDKGLVYVDCTGGDYLERLKEQWYGYTIEYDTIAYVVKGKEYGLVSIGVATSPKYSYYEQTGKWLSDFKTLGIVESIKIYW